MFETVLVANRGEIAVRVIRTLREMGIRSVAVHSDADAGALHTRLADVAVPIGPAPAAQSYLSIERVLEAAARTGSQAIHPGYGFLSENVEFARACEKAGIVFIGPPVAAIEAMGDKIRAKQTVMAAGVPVVPGRTEPGMTDAQVIDAAVAVGFPVLLKPSAGGGGRGMRVANDDSELVRGYPLARAEAEAAFGNGGLLLEKYLPSVRHVEIQVLADKHGHAIHLGERDCSSQRRHQKIVEEAPSPAVNPKLRQRMGSDALRGIRAIGYVNAGTLEFLLEPSGKYYFIEMNTRIQVEHPVTELVTGIDLVKWQLRIAAGEPLTIKQRDVQIHGHAVECRVNAEDPEQDFMPAHGEVEHFLPPGGPGVRYDSHLYSGYAPPRNYDSLLAKIVTWGSDRDEALVRMRRALRETVV
jgi:acetyl-CoA carboxylase biotin carboxylase subunit